MSQGSVVTRLSCGGMLVISFVAGLFPTVVAKECLNGEVSGKRSVASF